ncbi:MAG: autorepressor SdpR family transcription factor [Lactobacillaceae bacterium]|jgi:DNA-binding transcriptional ArsR family regulator|nr:autorepressor SdpR family transcription factor [Lactobacillaceae bacterium]
MAFETTFKALSNPVRREIVILLRAGKQSAGELSDHFELSGATISHHLKQLREADLIRETKYKNFIYYEINLSVFEEALFWLTEFTKEGDQHEA